MGDDEQDCRGYPHLWQALSFLSFYLIENIRFTWITPTVRTLSSKPELTFFKEHQIGACQFDALSRAKITLESLNFT